MTLRETRMSSSIGPSPAMNSSTPGLDLLQRARLQAATAERARDCAEVRRRDGCGARVHLFGHELLVLGTERLVVEHRDQQLDADSRGCLQLRHVHQRAGIAVHHGQRRAVEGHGRADGGRHRLADAAEGIDGPGELAGLAHEDRRDARSSGRCRGRHRRPTGKRRPGSRRRGADRRCPGPARTTRGSGSYSASMARVSAVRKPVLETRCSRQLLVQQLDSEFRVALEVVIGTLAGAHDDGGFQVDLDVAGVREDVAVLSRVVVETRAHADHDVRVREQLDGGAGGVQAGHADVVLGLAEPAFHRAGSSPAAPRSDLPGA